eukprot:GHVL01019764.1.p1 GENE.GHVL01019764.1~~GHVL01019764.1.p1  ORF type:complete len:321 (-),score=58.94 GHVL01019764.1:408-1370(-)
MKKWTQYFYETCGIPDTITPETVMYPEVEIMELRHSCWNFGLSYCEFVGIILHLFLRNSNANILSCCSFWDDEFVDTAVDIIYYIFQIYKCEQIVVNNIAEPLIKCVNFSSITQDYEYDKNWVRLRKMFTYLSLCRPNISNSESCDSDLVSRIVQELDDCEILKIYIADYINKNFSEGNRLCSCYSFNKNESIKVAATRLVEFYVPTHNILSIKMGLENFKIKLNLKERIYSNMLNDTMMTTNEIEKNKSKTIILTQENRQEIELINEKNRYEPEILTNKFKQEAMTITEENTQEPIIICPLKCIDNTTYTDTIEKKKRR